MFQFTEFVFYDIIFSMQKIIELFWHDLKRILKSKMAVVILLGMIFIPGIYAWLNIDSNWDPYDNTGEIPIAVVNQDEGVDMLKEEINIGDSLVEKLETNNAMKWVFTDEQDARAKVDSGDFYGAIIIPNDFSNKITTLFDGEEIEKPTFQFIVNDKKNPIAPIITTKAAGTLETTLDQAFVEAIALKTFEKAENANVEDTTATTISKVVTKIKETKEGVGRIRSTLNVVSAATSSTANALSAVRSLLPSSVNTFNNSALGDLQSLQKKVTNLNTANSNLGENIGNILDATERISGAIDSSVDSIDLNNVNYKNHAKQIISLLDALNTALQKQQAAIATLQNLTNSTILNDLQLRISSAVQHTNDLKTALQSVVDGNTAMLIQAKTKAHELHTTISDANSKYHNEIMPSVEKAINNISSAISDAIGSFSYISNAFSQSDTALESTINALNSTTTMNANIDVLLANLEDDLDKVAARISGATESDLYLKIINLLKNSPEEIADFISEPIATEKTVVYEIEHYGSKMAPFYTILATWVGCTLLVAILKTDIEVDEKKYKLHQAFFGRFMLFGIIAVCQGLVIGLGDLALGVQVLNVPLFLFAIMLSSLVFMLIIYSLAISFGKIGEAVAVVLMVMQVAGSGGTFPVELLPDFFQRVQPFMPFYPSMSAVRETIGGFYGASYFTFILILLCHTIIPLILGLIIRKPIVKIKQKISKDIEKTDVIV